MAIEVPTIHLEKELLVPDVAFPALENKIATLINGRTDHAGIVAKHGKSDEVANFLLIAPLSSICMTGLVIISLIMASALLPMLRTASSATTRTLFS